MTTEYIYNPADLVEIEQRARRLRAETFSSGIVTLKRWVAAPFCRRTAAKV